jgi:hypothetical protein
MDAAQRIREDEIPSPSHIPNTGAGSALQLAMNPFVATPSGSRTGRPLQTAFGEVVRQISLQTPVVLVVGGAGTGKSLLMDMTSRACVDMGLSARRVERNDQAVAALGTKSDVLLVDQTDSMSDATLGALLAATDEASAATMVFMCLPSCVRRFSFFGTPGTTIELTPLTLSDARNYLLGRASSIGRPNMFTPAALDLVIDGSRGLPRLLRSIAHLAFFAAASEGASQIDVRHVTNTLESRSAESQVIDAPKRRHVNPVPDANPGRSDLPPPVVAFEKKLREAYAPAKPTFDAERDEGDHRVPIRQPAAAAVAARPSVPYRASQSAVPAKTEMEATWVNTGSAEVWIPRVIGAFAATVAIGVAIPLMLMTSKPQIAQHGAVGSLTVARPADVKSAATSITTVIKSAPIKDAGAQPVRATKPNGETPKAIVQATAPRTSQSAQPPAKAPIAQKPIVANTVAPQTRDEPITPPIAARTEAASVNAPSPSVTTPTEPTPRANDAAAQAAALKAAADKAAEESAMAERAKAAEQAAILAQEAGRQAKAMRDAADRLKAEKDADEQGKVARQNANRQFSNSLFGVGR